MATKKFIIEVEEGETICEKCPLFLMGECSKIVKIFTKNRCLDIKLNTMKIKEYEDKD